MNTKSNRLLVVDDEAGIRDFLRTVAEQLDFEVYAIGNAKEFSGAVPPVYSSERGSHAAWRIYS